MYKFDSEAMIKELEKTYGVDEAPLSYEDFEEFMEEHEKMTERDLKGDL
jgi:hypothetical protein